MRPEERKRERGAALLVAVLLMALMGIVGLASMDTVTYDRRVAGFQKRMQTGLYAVEGGLAFAMGIVRRDAQALADGGEGALAGYDPAFPGKGTDPAQALGSDFPQPGSPTFSMDATASDPNNPSAPAQAIRYIGKGSPCPGWVMSGEEGSLDWSEALWDIRVRGSSPGGTDVLIQATAASCHPYN
jgi:hypothetical protein